MYKLTQAQNIILRLTDNVYIPQGNNGDWQIYEAWIAEGNTPEVADAPPIAVREIDARKLRLALLQLGHLSTVTSAISSFGEAAIIDWEYATIIREDYPLVLALASNLNLDIKAIFDLASSLV